MVCIYFFVLTATLAPTQLVCKSSEVKCDNKCIAKSKQCDGMPDCNDNSDEAGCGETNFVI